MTRALQAGRRAAISGRTGSVVVFLHGYGADGADLLGLADPLAPHLPDTTFLAPDAPERSVANPFGFQWFPIPWLDGSSQAAAEAGLVTAAEDLNRFLDEQLTGEGLTADRLVLVDKGTAKEFDGAIDDYIAYVLAKEPPSGAKDDAPRTPNKKDQRKAAAEAREKSQDLRKKAKAAEADLEKFTAQLSTIDQAMFDPAAAKPPLATLTMTELMLRRAEVEKKIAAAEAAWLEASEALEAFTG